MHVAPLCYDSAPSQILPGGATRAACDLVSSSLCSSRAEDGPLRAQRSPHADSVARMVDAWYFSSSDGERAVVTLPHTPAIYLTHMPHQQVRWRTEGRKGLTIPLEDARERMAMVLGTTRANTASTLVGRSRDSTMRTFL